MVGYDISRFHLASPISANVLKRAESLNLTLLIACGYSFWKYLLWLLNVREKTIISDLVHGRRLV